MKHSSAGTPFSRARPAQVLAASVLACALTPVTCALAEDLSNPEAVVRRLVRANAELDLATLSRLMAHDADITSYSIGGRKYVGWLDVEQAMREEFASVESIDIPIRELKVWQKDAIAWFTMELEYIRVVGKGAAQTRTLLPLRETGVLERRNGEWVLHSWHESFRTVAMASPASERPAPASALNAAGTGTTSPAPDLSGDWEILEVEDDKRYKATLDQSGNGPYTQHGGRFTTTRFSDRLWQGTWQQPGNDREGGFELLLSEDGTQAKGIWWYSRVGSHKNIPPREHGGTYVWKRTTPTPARR